jgi:hypothetical protein
VGKAQGRAKWVQQHAASGGSEPFLRIKVPTPPKTFNKSFLGIRDPRWRFYKKAPWSPKAKKIYIP